MTETTRGVLAITDDPTPWVVVRPNDSTDFCVLWLQGWKSTIASHLERIERMATRSGVTFAMIDYAGHGAHPRALEDSTRELQFNEVLVAYDTLQQEYKHVIVAGASFGGYMTALLTAQRTPYAAILRVPAIYDDSEFSMSYVERNARDELYQTFKRTVTSASPLAALKAISRYDRPVYIIEQEYDSIIPRNIPRSYFEAAKHGNYLVVPATDHSPMMMDDPEKHYAYIEHLIVSIVQALQLEAQLQPKSLD